MADNEIDMRCKNFVSHWTFNWCNPVSQPRKATEVHSVSVNIHNNIQLDIVVALRQRSWWRERERTLNNWKLAEMKLNPDVHTWSAGHVTDMMSGGCLSFCPTCMWLQFRYFSLSGADYRTIINMRHEGRIYDYCSCFTVVCVGLETLFQNTGTYVFRQISSIKVTDEQKHNKTRWCSCILVL